MSNNAIATVNQNTEIDWSTLERVVIQGDLSQLEPQERVAYYRTVCQSVGLNPTTTPFEYLRLSGKLTLYAKRDATDQLRRIHNVSVTITGRERIEDVYIVTARATMPTGRTDESTGVVSLTGLRGDNLANAFMKAETKAKRRVTLSICGLGMLDETETETIRGAVTEPVERVHSEQQERPAAVKSPPTVDATTGEILDGEFTEAPTLNTQTGEVVAGAEFIGVPPKPPMTQLAVRQLHEHAKRHGLWREARDHARETYQVDDLSQLTAEQGRELYRWITAEAERRKASGSGDPPPALPRTQLPAELDPSDEELEGRA